MSETITLPRSGVVLTQIRKDVFTAGVNWIVTMVRDPFVGSPVSDRWMASCADEKDDLCGTRDECIAWLDARVLETRAALLPHDARERVANAILAAHRKRYTLNSTPPQASIDLALEWADVALKALGIGGGA